MTDFIAAEALTALLQVVLIDLVLAGDNAIVIGLAAAGLPADQRQRAVAVGVLAATLLRIAFAGVAMQLLQTIGLLLAGGILLLWVCWKMWRELRLSHAAAKSELPLKQRQLPGYSRFAAQDIRPGCGANCGRTFLCLWTTCSPLPAQHANTPSFSSSACCFPSR
jgi:predicted tellurium resistance membrane protein TerC